MLLFDIENAIRSFDSIKHKLAVSHEDPYLVIYPVIAAYDGSLWQARQTFEPGYGDSKYSFISCLQFLGKVGQMEETANPGHMKISLLGSSPYTSGYQDFNFIPQRHNTELLDFLQKEHFQGKREYIKDVIGLDDTMIEIVGLYYVGMTASQIAKVVDFGTDQYASNRSRSTICNIAEAIIAKFRYHYPLYMRDNHNSQHTGGNMHALAKAMWKMYFK